MPRSELLAASGTLSQMGGHGRPSGPRSPAGGRGDMAPRLGVALRIAQEIQAGRVLSGIDRGLRILERRARLLGLEAPVKAEIAGPGGGPIEIETARQRISAMIRASSGRWHPQGFSARWEGVGGPLRRGLRRAAGVTDLRNSARPSRSIARLESVLEDAASGVIAATDSALIDEGYVGVSVVTVGVGTHAVVIPIT